MSTIDTFDVHCHIHETPATLGALDKNIAYCVQATRYTDWDSVARLREEHGDRVIPAFGLHPWFVESGEILDNWQSELKLLVKKYGGIVGECGLDKAARNPATGKKYPFEPQIALFKAQLTIAHELDVPISVHCVQAFGALADILREAEAAGTLPPRIMLHSYSGSPEMLQQVFLQGELGKRVYASYSRVVNGRNLQKTLQCIRVMPHSRVLVESDLHDASTTVLALGQAIDMVSEAYGWPLDEARMRLTENAQAGAANGIAGNDTLRYTADTNRSSTYSSALDDDDDDGGGHGTISSNASSSSGHSGRVDKVSRLEKYKGLPESLEEGVCNLPLELDMMACPPAFREQLEAEAYTLLDLTKLLARSTLPLFLRIHETKAATTHVLLLTVPTGARRLPRVVRNALKLGWPRVTTIKIINNITSLDEELDYKIWMPRDYERYFPNLGSISYIAYNMHTGYFREMCHSMGRQQAKSVVFRASQRHMDVLNLSSRLMRYMAHANFLLTNLSLTINSEPNYPDYVFTVIRTVLLTDLAAPTNLRLNVDSTDLLYKITENKTLHFISTYPEDEGTCANSNSDELTFCKPSVRELTLRFKEIGKLGIPFAARHFPNLRRLVLTAHADVGHPSLENTLYGCMFLERWSQLSRLQLAHINDTLVQLLASSCPQLSELIVFNSATHEQLMANNSFDIHRNLIPLPNMPSMRFTPKSLHYLLTRLPLLRVLDLNYPLYVDPLTKPQDIDYSLASSLLKAVEMSNSQYPRLLRYLSIPFIPLTVHGISGILSAFQSLATLEVRLAATPRPASSSRRKLLSRVKEAIPRQTHDNKGGRRPAELNSLWIWSDWSSATSTLSQVMDLFAQSRKLPRVYVPYIAGINSPSEVETRLIMQHMKKEMPAVHAHRFEYSVCDYY